MKTFLAHIIVLCFSFTFSFAFAEEKTFETELQLFKDFKPRQTILDLVCELASISSPSISKTLISEGLEMKFGLESDMRYICQLLHHQDGAKVIIKINGKEMIDIGGDGDIDQAREGKTVLEFNSKIDPKILDNWIRGFAKAVSDIRVRVFVDQFSRTRASLMSRTIYNPLKLPVVQVTGNSEGFILYEFTYKPSTKTVYTTKRRIRIAP